jgi:hypothetical protein
MDHLALEVLDEERVFGNGGHGAREIEQNLVAKVVKQLLLVAASVA